ncbi:thioredoxin reductase 1, cytoplasmic-like isoform X2 [Corticium candelabrum]|uniref:thioredoxin reductase 1, cytoplasmic-like isoform X2 n=1 Tax=Corticium candelabrum TaxID=121492 RepID=UPI002E26AA46|nr:thioredoxin reductase 1, cytoplasmic-like isoform X2 [Corticium candelabrum]
MSRTWLHRWQLKTAAGVTRICGRLFSANGDRYDLVVIGGGSGGLACAKEAAGLGAQVAVLDYVVPSVQGSSWGLGGTCVNVGCIPKKLMHHAALLGEGIRDSRSYGWKVEEERPELVWSQLLSTVQGHIKSLNWGHRVQLKDKNVTYLNAKGKLLDRHTISALNMKGEVTEVKASNIVLATGTRPKIPDDMARLIVRNMERHGTVVHHNSIPVKVERLDDGRLDVVWQHTNQNEGGLERGVFQDVFDTVLVATGRGPDSKALGLDAVSVETDVESGKVIVDERDETTVPHIFCIGDAADGRPELTPVAIKAGKLLSRRLFGNSTHNMDYNNIPTTVFTPMEYGCVGLSTEKAINQFGSENIETYHAFYHPLELTIPPERENQLEDHYIKTVCVREGNDDRVVGIHFLGPNAGEVIQGFAVAMRAPGGLPMSQITSTIGIHPTNAEEVVKLYITKSSGRDPVVTGC